MPRGGACGRMTRHRLHAGQGRTVPHPGPRVEPARLPARAQRGAASGPGGRQTITPGPAGARSIASRNRSAKGFPGSATTCQRPDAGATCDRRRGGGRSIKVVVKTRNQGATPWSEDVDVSTRSLRPARARSSRATATSAIVAFANALSALGGSQPSRPAISTTSWLTVIELRCRSLRKRLSSFTDPIGNSALAATCHRTRSRTESATGPASIVTFERPAPVSQREDPGPRLAQPVRGPTRTGWQRSEAAS